MERQKRRCGDGATQCGDEPSEASPPTANANNVAPPRPRAGAAYARYMPTERKQRQELFLRRKKLQKPAALAGAAINDPARIN